MTASPTYYAAIAPGDTITVIFDGTTPDLTCDYQRLSDNGNTVIATTPPGTPVEDPTVVVHYIDDFQYFYKGVPPVGTNVDEQDVIGQNVTIRFDRQNNAIVTGLVTAVDGRARVFKLDVGGAVTYVPFEQIWTITVN